MSLDVILKGETFNKEWLANILGVSVADIEEHAADLDDWICDMLFDSSLRWFLGNCEDWGVVVRENCGGMDAEIEKITYAELFKRLASVGYSRATASSRSSAKSGSPKARLNVFASNYDLLQRFAPEMIKGPAPDFFLSHISEDSQFDNASAERQDDNIVNIGTYYRYDLAGGYNSPDGDLVSDPSLTVLFDNARRLARVQAWTLNNPGMSAMGTAFYEDFECSIDSAETDREREANDYLGQWLTKFVTARGNDPNYFEQRPID